ncbi:MAG: hypothetical protein AAGU27_13845 [Dehalobacterium sp.]
MLMLFGVMISIIAAIFIFSLSNPDTNRYHPENGILNLQSWKPEQDGALSLSRQWSFYWQRFLSYQEIAAERPEPDLVANVPGE